MTWALARVVVVCLSLAALIKRSRRAAVLAGLAAVVLVAGFGLSVPLASLGPKAPPLSDLAGTAALPNDHHPAGRLALAIEAAPAAVNRLVEVRRGDTLGRIASRYRCVSINQLAAINGIRPPRYMIRIGQLVKIPTCP